MILAWWPYILTKKLMNIPKIGCLNFHPSYLPYNRGKHPNFWTLIENSPFGVSLHLINEKIDGGDIVFQKRIKKDWQDTGKTLHEKSKREIIDLFKKNYKKIINGRFPRKKQNLRKGSFHLAFEIDQASKIELNKKYPARDLLNILKARTYSGFPAAWFIDQGKKYEVTIEIKKV